jgi:hypothetical protein
MLGLTALYAQKNNEFKTMWTGNFYDSFLERNYRINSFFGELDSKHEIIFNIISDDSNKNRENSLVIVKSEGGNINKTLKVNKNVFKGLDATQDSDEYLIDKNTSQPLLP